MRKLGPIAVLAIALSSFPAPAQSQTAFCYVANESFGDMCWGELSSDLSDSRPELGVITLETDYIWWGSGFLDPIVTGISTEFYYRVRSERNDGFVQLSVNTGITGSENLAQAADGGYRGSLTTGMRLSWDYDNWGGIQGGEYVREAESIVHGYPSGWWEFCGTTNCYETVVPARFLSVPEPGALLLIATGLMAMLALRRDRRTGTRS